MIPQKYVDPFFFRQPPLSFVEELKKPVHEEKSSFFARTEAREGEISVSGMVLCPDFPDPQGLLETAYADFRRFLSVFESLFSERPLCITCLNAFLSFWARTIKVCTTTWTNSDCFWLCSLSIRGVFKCGYIFEAFYRTIKIRHCKFIKLFFITAHIIFKIKVF